MSAFYPPSLSYVCRKLNAYSRNRCTLYPQSLQTAGPNDVIVVSLPANALVDLQSLAMHFTMSTTTTAGFAAAPRHIECLIDSIAVECNGVIVDQAALLYGHVFKMWLDVMGGDKGPQRAILQNGAGSGAAPAANLTNQQFAITNWLGFLGSAKPNCIDTSLTGPIRIYIKMAPAAVLPISAAATVPNYSINSIKFGLEFRDVADGIYYQLLQKRLESGTPIEVPFDSYFTFFGSPSGLSSVNTKFNLSTQSLDMLMCTVLDPNWLTNAVPDTTTLTSRYFTRGFAAATAGTAIQSQVGINSVMYPISPANTGEVIVQSLQATGAAQDMVGQADAGFNNVVNYLQKFFFHIIRLSHIDPEGDGRLISGIDTRGSNAAGYWDLRVPTGDNGVPLVIAKTTSVLRIGAYQQLDVVL